MGVTDCKKCRDCGGECCKSVAIKLEDPQDIDDYLDFKWYIFHPGLTVYLDDEDDWHVDVPIKCRHLKSNSQCAIYKDRPPVCRDYDVKECDNGMDMKIELTTPEEVDSYIAKLKKQGHFTKDGKVKK
jgi:Fe-S-cluster containining protein